MNRVGQHDGVVAGNPTPARVASVGRHEAVSLGLLTDLDGRVLVAQTARGHGHWLLPGGAVTRGESPRVACRRALADRFEVQVPVGELLVSAWQPVRGVPEFGRLSYVFDCGIVHESGELRRRIARVGACTQQLLWMKPGVAVTTLPPFQAQLLLAARAGSRYVEDVAGTEVSSV